MSATSALSESTSDFLQLDLFRRTVSIVRVLFQILLKYYLNYPIGELGFLLPSHPEQVLSARVSIWRVPEGPIRRHQLVCKNP